MDFHHAAIDGVLWLPLKKYHDARGWLCELFRNDEVRPEHLPTMCYLSMTEPEIVRGPHEHREQTDYFCFLGPSNFKVYLWDIRPASQSYRARQTDLVGADKPMAVIVPPGVVHAYKNVGLVPGLVVNCPNRLYQGAGRKEMVDEIRHESRSDSPFHID
jgi:dTDP-4-dehydrorhamnose 3,5-epimerase